MLAEDLRNIGNRLLRCGRLRNHLNYRLRHHCVKKLGGLLKIELLSVKSYPVIIIRYDTVSSCDYLINIVFLQTHALQHVGSIRRTVLEHAAGEKIMDIGKTQRTAQRSQNILLVLCDDIADDILFLIDDIFSDRKILLEHLESERQRQFKGIIVYQSVCIVLNYF